MNLPWITLSFLILDLILQSSSSPTTITAELRPLQILTPTSDCSKPAIHSSKLIKRQLTTSSQSIHQRTNSFNPRATIDSDFVNNSLSSGAGSIEHAHEELFKIVPEVGNIYLAITLIPAFIVIFGSFSAIVKEKLYIGESTISVVFGIILGPYVSGVFDPRSWSEGRNFDELTLEISRIVVALSVFAAGVELPKAYILRHWRSLAFLIGPAMLYGWMISGVLIFALVPALTFLEALVIASAITPTDAVLAASVVGKGKYAQKHVPAHLRNLLQAESGCNDGAAFPFLYLAMFLLLREETSIGSVIGKWVLLVILYQILLGIIIGAVVGVLARKTLKFCKRRSMIDKESMVAMYVALALLTTGVTALAGSDDLLAAFSCGAAFAWDGWFTDSIEASNFSSILDLLINCTTFIYIGATIPFSSWNDPALTLVPWRLVVLGFSILLLRRLPIMILMQKIVPDFKTRREAVFCGHFGPIGVGAIFISTLATIKLPTPQVPPQTSLDVLALTAQSIIYLLVLFSILVHGLSIPFFNLGKNVHSRVHTMTRTWTQASGNEPSWLSRVKRVEKPTEDNVDAAGNVGESNNDSTPVDRPNTAVSVDQGQRQISDDQITQVESQNPKDEISATATPHQFELSNSPLPPSTQIINPATPDRVMLKLSSSNGLLRLGSRAKRTPEQQAAHERDKLLRDAWCRPERIDVLKKDEERVYKCGRLLVIESGDGEEVQVHSLPQVSSGKSSRSPPDGSPNTQSHSAQTRKFDLAKLIASGSIRKLKVSQAHDSSDAISLPGQGPSAHSLVGQLILPSNELRQTPGSGAQSVGRPDGAVWIEGDQTILQLGVENIIGADVIGESGDCNLIRSSRSLPTLTRSTSFGSLKSVSKTSLPNSTFAVNPRSDIQLTGNEELTIPARPESKLHEDCDNDWEEDDDNLALEPGTRQTPLHDNETVPNRSPASHRRHSSHQSRRPRRKISGRLSGVPVAESGHPRKPIDSVVRPLPSRAVEFVNVEKQKSRAPTRSKSPSSRSIRFAKYPERPSKPSQVDYKKLLSSKPHHKNSHSKKDKNKLKGVVSPVVDSWRRSSLSGGMLTPSSNHESIQKGDYFSSSNDETPSQTANCSSVVDDNPSNVKEDEDGNM